MGLRVQIVRADVLSQIYTTGARQNTSQLHLLAQLMVSGRNALVMSGSKIMRNAVTSMTIIPPVAYS
jgi:hypothetical protein